MTTQENKITTILISVVLLFLFCQTPAAIMLIYSLIPGMDHGSNMVLGEYNSIRIRFEYRVIFMDLW